MVKNFTWKECAECDTWSTERIEESLIPESIALKPTMCLALLADYLAVIHPPTDRQFNDPNFSKYYTVPPLWSSTN